MYASFGAAVYDVEVEAVISNQGDSTTTMKVQQDQPLFVQQFLNFEASNHYGYHVTPSNSPVPSEVPGWLHG